MGLLHVVLILIYNVKLSTPDCKLLTYYIFNLRSSSANSFISFIQLSKIKIKTGQCKSQTVDCTLRTGGEIQTEGKMQAADQG